MSEFHEAIRWQKNGEIQLLFFIVGYQGDQKSIPEIEMLDGQSSNFYDYSEDSIYQVALLEIRAKDVEEAGKAEDIVKEVFLKFSNHSETIICMFDGSYLSSEDLVDEENIGHIYAVKTPDIEKFGISDEHRHSDSWKTDIRLIQRKIIRSYGNLA